MFVNIRRPNTILKNTSSPVDLTEADVIKLRRNNFRKSVIDNYAEIIKQKRKEWEDYENDCVVALYLKEQHFNNVAKNIRSVSNVASVGVLASLFKNSSDKKVKDSSTVDINFLIQNLINGLSNNSEEISALLIQYYEPDYTIEQESSVINSEKKKVIVSEYQGKSVSSILKDLQIPEGISSEVDDIWNNGLTLSNSLSFITNSISYFKEKEKKVDMSGFGRKMKTTKNESSSDDDSDSEYYDSDSSDESDSD